MASNRKTVRKAFAALLVTPLAALAATVYDYRVGDFQGLSPVVVVSSNGILRSRATMTVSKATMYLQVDIFVAYSDQDAQGEADAEDLLDDIEAAIAGVCDEDQPPNANWYALSMAERSQRIPVEVGGTEYIREMLTIAAETMG